MGVTKADRSLGPSASAPQMPWPVLPLCALGMILCVALSQYALLAMGISYNVPGGNPLKKIHPASYVFVIAFVFFALHRGYGITRLAHWLRERSWLLGFTVCCILVTLYKLSLGDTTGTAALVDSFLVPSLVLLILADLSVRARHRLCELIIVLALVNALIAMAEAALHTHLIPAVIHDIKGRIVNEGVFRATALMGHPLRNALLTACSLIALVASRWPVLIRFGCAATLSMALLAFGGRSAAIIGVICAGYVAAGQLDAYMRRSAQAFAFAAWSGLILISLSVSAAAAVLLETNFGSRILSDSFNDVSSQARYDLVGLVASVDFGDLWIGFSFIDIAEMVQANHLPDIESFWVYLLLYLGVIGFAVWLLGFLGALQYLFRTIQKAGRVILVCALLVASTSVSLSSKDCLLDAVFALACGAGLVSTAVRRDGVGSGHIYPLATREILLAPRALFKTLYSDRV